MPSRGRDGIDARPPADIQRRRTLRRALQLALVASPGIGPRAGFAQNTSSPQASGEEDPQARQILQRADEIRFPKDSFQVEARITSTSGGQPQDPRRYRILSKGNDNTIIITLEPSAEKGQNLLMKGRELWLFMPSVSQPVRLSLSQRLTGQVANGDLARVNFSGDYIAMIKGQETIGGREHHVLELSAGERSVTYPKIFYWVRAGDFHPQRAEFHSLSGKLLKTCRYEQFAALGGRIRPTRLVLSDALKRGDESILEYSDLKTVDLPDRMFSKDYLKKLD